MKPGWFQCVIPGIRMRSKSAMMASKSSAVSGAASGSAFRTSPGATLASTGNRSGFSMKRAIHSTIAWPCLRNSAGDMSPKGPAACPVVSRPPVSEVDCMRGKAGREKRARSQKSEASRNAPVQLYSLLASDNRHEWLLTSGYLLLLLQLISSQPPLSPADSDEPSARCPRPGRRGSCRRPSPPRCRRPRQPSRRWPRPCRRR